MDADLSWCYHTQLHPLSVCLTGSLYATLFGHPLSNANSNWSSVFSFHSHPHRLRLFQFDCHALAPKLTHLRRYAIPRLDWNRTLWFPHLDDNLPTDTMVLDPCSYPWLSLSPTQCTRNMANTPPTPTLHPTYQIRIDDHKLRRSDFLYQH